MELDELKSAWNTANEKVARLENVQMAMLQTIQSQHTHNASRRLKRAPIFELIVAVLVAWWSGGFIGGHLDQIGASPVAALPGLIVFGLSIWTIWLSISQLLLISGLDFGSAVIDTQKRIARLKTLRVRSTQFVLLAGLPFWMIFPFFLGQSLVGYRLAEAFDPKWIIGNIIVGVVLAGLLVGAIKLWHRRSPFLHKLDDALAGREVIEAQDMLAQIKGFEAA